MATRCGGCRSSDITRRSRDTGTLWCWRCSLDVLARLADDLTARDVFEDVVVMGEAVFRDGGRAGGGVVCEVCGKAYHRHPNLPGPKLAFLTLLCGGRVVKL
jgi:hypothetical protein